MPSMIPSARTGFPDGVDTMTFAAPAWLTAEIGGGPARPAASSPRPWWETRDGNQSPFGHQGDFMQNGVRGRSATSADLCGVHHDIAEVVAGGVVEGAAAGDQPQLGVGDGTVDILRREVVLQVGLDRGDAELDERPVGSPDVDLVPAAQRVQPPEDPW